jgi:hypothetical protein
VTAILMTNFEEKKMKKFLVLTIIALAMSLNTFSQAKQMTVKDYFLAIPTEFMKSAPAKRAAWIESDSADDGYLSYNIPVKEVTGEDGEGKVWGNVQIFEKTAGGLVLGMSTNLCEDGGCQGQLLFLDYNGGKWEDVTSDLAPQPDNDEVIKILRDAPAFENKEMLKDGEQVPLYISFNGTNKVIDFTAGGVNGDGGVVAKMFKWNGEAFVEFKYEESPE